jgi:uncharacterized membrane protein
MNKNERIQIIDAARGFCIILVIAYHGGYNLVVRELIPEGALYNPLLAVLQPFFAGVFIMLAGVSSRLSRNNLKRGLQLTGCAALVTAVSLIYGEPIWFGILHLLAACVLLYALLSKLRIVIPFTAMAAFFALWFGIEKWPAVPSADHFPIVPWGFVFFFGVWLGGLVKEMKLPGWFYSARIPVLPAIGRKTLIIYLLHQPVMYGLLYVLTPILRA